MILTLALTALLSHTPAGVRAQAGVPIGALPPVRSSLHQVTALSSTERSKAGSATSRHFVTARSSSRHALTPTARNLAVDLHPMTEEERQLYPGRERFDKTEWYESQFKSAKVVTQPEHVDEWNNGGVDAA